MTKQRRAKPALPVVVGKYYVRKRDKTFVVVSKFSRQKVEYTTYPLLYVWDTTKEAFQRGFRLATEKEIETAAPDWRPT